MSDDYIKLRNKYKKADPTGYRRGNTDTSSIKSSQLGTNLKKNLAKLKKDLTWKPLPKVDLDNLPKKELSRDDAIGMAMDLMQTTPTGALAGVIKDKGGNWLGDSVKRALEGLHRGRSVKRSDPTTFERLGEDYVGPSGSVFTPEEYASMLGDYKLNSWVDGPLQKYVKNRMATPDDEIRKLADQGILHVDPEQLNYRLDMYGKEYLMQLGQRNMAISDAAKVWEGASDNAVGVDTAQRIRTMMNGLDHDKNFNTQYPWFERLATEQPEAKVYDLPYGTDFSQDLGFDHLMDELRNALDEGSGLPQNLRLTPEGLQGLSVEEAVKKVHGINQFRAEKAKKANARFAAAEGIPVYKEYPEGYRWLEYKLPEADESQVGRFKVVKDPISGKSSTKDTYEDQLADWLKQEGDTMGHCVGGYCDDVIQGRSRILSLRDNEGRSVATVELSPHIDYNNPEQQSWMINQIKGAGNRKPPKDAIPFIQDFVKSGKWGDVRDLANAELVNMAPFSGNYIEGYMNKDEAYDAVKKHFAERYPGMDHGGWFDALDEMFGE